MKAQLRIENELKLLKEKHITEHDGDYSLEPEGRYWRGVRIGLEVALNILAESAPLPEARGAEEAAMECAREIYWGSDWLHVTANGYPPDDSGPGLQEMAAVIRKHMQHSDNHETVDAEAAAKEICDSIDYNFTQGAEERIATIIRRHTHAPGEGWQWVPKEPTEAMIDAGAAVNCPSSWDGLLKEVEARYKAMLAAAPSPEGKNTQETDHEQ